MKTRKSGKAKYVAAALMILLVAGYAAARSVLYNEYNNEKAVEYLNEHAERRSVGLCAKYVRLAIEAGGCPTFGQPMSACDYVFFLPDLGFEEVSAEGYKPRKGDVVVFSAIGGHMNGHIAMYNGKQWVSDFRQRRMYSASAYKKDGTHTYWRREDGKKWRKVSVRNMVRAVSGI